jgi:hypothetical protein
MKKQRNVPNYYIKAFVLQGCQLRVPVGVGFVALAAGMGAASSARSISDKC